ncbi:adenylyltransferase/cytidyltransferase family protein [Pseudomonas sp. PDM22]|uniref:adenylyltransferase/cytidyltransferase family protein n=1 Tax=Pseudomonas sp. PDM22 TaxID=2769287 RepID=UPI0009DAF31C|nr:adenylyltransferase/cytidyltransferase family protein [Pseudomonas sp. PDM22]MBD9514026.1 adenylyltransferase/cytidyltransferase family protein [Pseudomonas sp. PDM22]OQR35048.1 glycerol-3-phosphate cytidylyltransferase [Pseudomonas sp. T]
MKKTILTYGTFDLFHIGHLNILRNLKALGDILIVGVSTDEFNLQKGKKTAIPFHERIEIIKSIKYVDIAIPESTWDQKKSDIFEYSVSTFAIGDDWAGKFDHLKEYCQVIYLPRTEGISTTQLKNKLKTSNHPSLIKR